jgi:preprotein translocase subunit SecE
VQRDIAAWERGAERRRREPAIDAGAHGFASVATGRCAGIGRKAGTRCSGTATGKIMVRTNLFKFMQEVRSETQKVTWPSRRETLITTAMVFVMVALASIFFLLADQLIRIVVTYLLGVGG